MRNTLSCMTLLVLPVFSANAFAQAVEAAPKDEDPVPVQATSAASEAEAPYSAVEPAPSASPAASTPPTASAPPVPARSGIACVVGQHPKEWPDSARTATELVCDALRNRGVPVGAASIDPGNAQSAYVVHLDQLGSAFFLRVVHEDPVGTPKTSKRMSLSELPEAEFAAPRLADAIVTGKNVEGTQGFANIVGSESRKIKKKKGEFVVGGGITALSIPGADAYMGPALNLFGFYETPAIGIGLQLQVGDASNRRDEDADFTAVSVGVRYFFNELDFSPFVGGGLAMEYMSLSNDDSYDSVDGSGLAAFAEVGLEMFRLHSTHFIASLRADVPFFVLRDDPYRSYSYDDTGRAVATESGGNEKRYEVPLMLNVGVGF